jgi:hypothetical protein
MSDFECEYEDDGYDYTYDDSDGGGDGDAEAASMAEDGEEGDGCVDPAIEMENAFYEGVRICC